MTPLVSSQQSHIQTQYQILIAINAIDTMAKAKAEKPGKPEPPISRSMAAARYVEVSLRFLPHQDFQGVATHIAKRLHSQHLV